MPGLASVVCVKGMCCIIGMMTAVVVATAANGAPAPPPEAGLGFAALGDNFSGIGERGFQQTRGTWAKRSKESTCAGLDECGVALTWDSTTLHEQ